MKKSQSSALLAASTIATIASQQPLAVAFQCSAPPIASRSHRIPPPMDGLAHGSLRSRLRTASKESAQIASEGGSSHPDEEEPADDDGPWALRQITFLGLSAPPPENDEVDDGPSSRGAALDARGLSEFLMEIGACSVSITDSDADTEDESPLFDEPSSASCSNEPPDDDGTDERWAMAIPDLAAGRNLWKKCDVAAHFPPSVEVPDVVDAVRRAFVCASVPRYSVDDVPDRDWIRHVQESWRPVVTGGSKFVLRFPWHGDRAVMGACQEAEREGMRAAMERRFASGVKREGAVVHFEDDDDDDDAGGDVDPMTANAGSSRDYVQIRLEGGMAFGTGEHPTTRLCLDWVRDSVENHLARSYEDDGEGGPLRFLDYGAGSGVLGIAAASVVRDHDARSRRRRKQATSGKELIVAVGVEIDADAIRIANDNAERNDVVMGNYLPDPESLDAEALSVAARAMQRERNRAVVRTLPEELNGPMYDLCAANILAAPLVGLAPTIASMVKSPGGGIGLSGVLATQADSVVEAYAEFFDEVKVSAEEGGWVLITGVRR